MSEFNVNREMVQELAETGAIQIPMSVLPEERELSDMLGHVGDRTFSVVSVYADFEALGIFPELVTVARDLLKICYAGRLTWQRVRQQAFTPKSYETGKWHKDAEGRLTGISFLFTNGKCPSEGLMTGGRGSCPENGKKYFYRNGPVVIAQTDFGAPTLSSISPDLGATWHAGDRNQACRVGALDFLLH